MFDRSPAYETTLQWLREFVMREHPLLGRPGAVCPRLAPAVDRDLLWMVTVEVPDATEDAARASGRLLADLFEDLVEDAAVPQARTSAALLGLLPDLAAARPGRAAQVAEFIDGGHAALKLEFVARGLMLGEFHPGSSVASVHNRDLAVMRAPVPMFAVRALSPHDLVFLDRPDIDPEQRGRYLDHYLHHLGDRLTAAQLRRASDAAERARAER